MKRILTLTLFLLLLIPSSAFAHTLSSTRVRVETRAYIITHNISDGIKGWEVKRCKRRSAHAVSCAFELYNWNEQTVCAGRLRVSYRGRYSYFTRHRVISNSC